MKFRDVAVTELADHSCNFFQSFGECHGGVVLQTDRQRREVGEPGEVDVSFQKESALNE